MAIFDGLKSRKSVVGGCALLLFFICMGFIFAPVLPVNLITPSPDMAKFYPQNWQTLWVESWLTGKTIWIPSMVLDFLGSPLWRRELFFVVTSLFAGLGLFYYMRTQKFSPLAAIASGLIFSLCGYSLTLFSAGHGGYFELISCFLFSFGLLYRCFERRKFLYFALLGGVVAWSEIRQPDVWFLFLLLLAAYGIWLTLRWRRREGSFAFLARVYPRFLVSILCLAAIAGVNLKTAVTDTVAGREKQIFGEQGKSTDPKRAEEERESQWIFATNWSLPPEDIAEFFIPGLYGNASFVGSRPYWGRLGQPHGFKPGLQMPNYRQHTVYLGVVALLLGWIGMAGWWKTRKGGEESVSPPEDSPSADFSDAPFWIGTSVVATLFALGRYTPVYHLFYALPKMDLIRCPVKFHHLTEVAVAVLAGMGIETLLDRTFDTLRRRAWIFAAAGSVLLALACLLCLGFSGKMTAHITALGIGRFAPAAELASYAGANAVRSLLLLLIAGGALFVLSRLSRSSWLSRAVVPFLIVLGCLDLSGVARRFVEVMDLSAHVTENSVVRCLKRESRGKPAHMINYLASGNEAQNWLGLSLFINGYDDLSPMAGPFYADLYRAHSRNPPHYWRVTGARYVILPFAQAGYFVRQGAARPIKSFYMDSLARRVSESPVAGKGGTQILLLEVLAPVPPALFPQWIGGISAERQKEELCRQPGESLPLSDAPAPGKGKNLSPIRVELEHARGLPGELATSATVRNPYRSEALLVLPDRGVEKGEAYIDGKSAPLYTVNGQFSGILVPPGTHRVEARLKYYPLLPAISLAVSLLILLWGAGEVLRIRKKRG